jgi:hypothetical protein
MNSNRLRGVWIFPAIALVAVGLNVAAAPAANDSTPMVPYHGMHPVSPHQGAFCYIDVPHLHRVPPPDMRVYVSRKTGEFVFVGDPVALGYDGPKVGYFGQHLLVFSGLPPGERIFCYITGPHYHAVGPADAASYIFKDGVHWYKGEAPPVDHVRDWINEVHAIKGYLPPKVDIAAAPPGYRPFQVPEKPAVLVAPSIIPPGKRPAAGNKIGKPVDKAVTKANTPAPGAR